MSIPEIRNESIPRCRSWILRSNRAWKALGAGNSTPLYVRDDDSLGPLYSEWGNFENWLRYYAWVFWALISLLTLSILINLWSYWERWAHLHMLKERDRNVTD